MTMTKADVKRIVDEEMKRLLKDEVKKHVVDSLKRGEGKKEMKAAILDGLNDFIKSLYTKRNTWNNDIK